MSDTQAVQKDLYILRHAKAEERGQKFSDDSKRPLSKEGIKLQKAACKGIIALNVKFDFILSSPFARAKHTAEIVAECMESKQPRYSKHLKPGGDMQALIQELVEHHANSKSILLVGHEPDLSLMISKLTCGSEKLRIPFKKSGLCKLTYGELRYGRCAQLDWLLTQKQLALIGKNSRKEIPDTES